MAREPNYAKQTSYKLSLNKVVIAQDKNKTFLFTCQKLKGFALWNNINVSYYPKMLFMLNKTTNLITSYL